LEGTGKIELTLQATSNDAVIRIRDNGRGIPAHVLPRLFDKGFSFGKSQGSGLGLYHARECLLRSGGELAISSQLGEGATVTIHLPRHSPPSWFPGQLSLGADSTVVVVDDDPSIHAVWRQRLAGIAASEHFTSPVDFRTWLAARAALDRMVFLVDYEFTHAAENGLDVIERCRIAPRSLLVTFRYGESDVQARANDLGVPILPKNLATRIPLQVSDRASKNMPIVLVDNDPLVRSAWEKSAKAHGYQLKAYSSYREFQAHEAEISPVAFVYLDYHLGESSNGLTVARELRGRGYRHIVITSGESPSLAGEEGGVAWIGKTPPWEEKTVEDILESSLKVAHDLRPILMALGVAIEQLSGVPEAERQFLEETRERLRRVIGDLNRR
jgi:FixJ family two-component response regulator